MDLVLAALIVALAVRGWLRGFVRESISFAVLVVGLFVAFRLSTPGGVFVESLAGTSADASRLAAGLVIFLLISATAAIVSAFMHRGIRVMPGLPTANRAAGAGLAVLLGVVALTIVLSVAGVLSLPSAVAAPVAESTIASRLVDPSGPVQDAVGLISGDRVMEHVLKLQDAVGERRLVADDGVVFIPAAEEEEIDASDDKTAEIRSLVERERAAAGAGSLEPSAPLDAIALEYARSVYLTGRFSNRSVTGEDIGRRLDAAQIPWVTSGQVMVLAASPKSAQEGLMADSEASLVVVDDAHRRIGVAAVKGPLGWIVVQVYAG